MLYVGLAVNGPLVAVLVAVFARVKIANPDGDCFRKFVTALELLLLAQFLEVGGLCILLLGLDGKERVVVKYAVDKEGVPRPLPLDIEKTVVLRMGENVQSDSTPFGNPELKVALELELEIVDLVTLLKVKDRVEKIRENQLVVKELAEGWLVLWIQILDTFKNLRNLPGCVFCGHNKNPCPCIMRNTKEVNYLAKTSPVSQTRPAMPPEGLIFDIYNIHGCSLKIKCFFGKHEIAKKTHIGKKNAENS